MYHADNMPLLSVSWLEVKPLTTDVWQITFEVENEKIIPTRTAHAANKRIGLPDTLTLSGDGVSVIASGTLENRIDRTFDATEHQRHIIVNERGIPGESQRVFRYIVSGAAGSKATVVYAAQKARELRVDVELKEQAFEAQRELVK
jgi:hypothetical protein